MPVIRNQKLRSILRVLLPVLLVGLVFVSGLFAIGERQYAGISLLAVILSLGLFFTGYERRKTGSRRMVLVVIMTALSVTGRFLPLCKPVTALTILSGMYLGAEAGFLTGALSALISNFYFGQGPWTPFQMLAWGIIGLLAGIFAKWLKEKRVLLYGFGLLSGALFSFVMDVWTVLWYHGSFQMNLFLGAAAAAAPFTVLYAGSNVLFLALFAEPFGRKMRRMQKKYGI